MKQKAEVSLDAGLALLPCRSPHCFGGLRLSWVDLVAAERTFNAPDQEIVNDFVHLPEQGCLAMIDYGCKHCVHSVEF